MIYVKRLILPSDAAETSVITAEKRTCFSSFYPFKLFPMKGLRSLELGELTMFYGGNGSGKSTLLNVLAGCLDADRYSDFNSSPFFDRYVSLCHTELLRHPPRSTVLTSDDVFDYVLSARDVNSRIDQRREELFDKYVAVRGEALQNPDIGLLHGLDDYARWRDTRDILSKRRSQSQYVRERNARDVDLYSNGETSMRYFLDRIDRDGVYLLDEPENSLSVEYQIELADYLRSALRSSRVQLVVATHSPILLSIEGAKIYDLDACPVAECGWTELPNVRRYFGFFISRREEFEK